MKSADFDVVIIGSGFGGSVAALRLTEKGYKVAVLEAGRRFADKDFPKTSWRLNRFLYMPRLGLRGIQRIHVLPDVLILAGAGSGKTTVLVNRVEHIISSRLATPWQVLAITFTNKAAGELRERLVAQSVMRLMIYGHILFTAAVQGY